MDIGNGRRIGDLARVLQGGGLGMTLVRDIVCRSRRHTARAVSSLATMSATMVMPRSSSIHMVRRV